VFTSLLYYMGNRSVRSTIFLYKRRGSLQRSERLPQVEGPCERTSRSACGSLWQLSTIIAFILPDVWDLLQVGEQHGQSGLDSVVHCVFERLQQLSLKHDYSDEWLIFRPFRSMRVTMMQTPNKYAAKYDTPPPPNSSPIHPASVPHLNTNVP
jgi:hypothetical protein